MDGKSHFDSSVLLMVSALSMVWFNLAIGSARFSPQFCWRCFAAATSSGKVLLLAPASMLQLAIANRAKFIIRLIRLRFISQCCCLSPFCTSSLKGIAYLLLSHQKGSNQQEWPDDACNPNGKSQSELVVEQEFRTETVPPANRSTRPPQQMQQHQQPATKAPAKPTECEMQGLRMKTR